MDINKAKKIKKILENHSYRFCYEFARNKKMQFANDNFICEIIQACEILPELKLWLQHNDAYPDISYPNKCPYAIILKRYYSIKKQINNTPDIIPDTPKITHSEPNINNIMPDFLDNDFITPITPKTSDKIDISKNNHNTFYKLPNEVLYNIEKYDIKLLPICILFYILRSDTDIKRFYDTKYIAHQLNINEITLKKIIKESKENQYILPKGIKSIDININEIQVIYNPDAFINCFTDFKVYKFYVSIKGNDFKYKHYSYIIYLYLFRKLRTLKNGNVAKINISSLSTIFNLNRRTIKNNITFLSNCTHIENQNKIINTFFKIKEKETNTQFIKIFRNNFDDGNYQRKKEYVLKQQI